jgi:hypothetical protein
MLLQWFCDRRVHFRVLSILGSRLPRSCLSVAARARRALSPSESPASGRWGIPVPEKIQDQKLKMLYYTTNASTPQTPSRTTARNGHFWRSALLTISPCGQTEKNEEGRGRVVMTFDGLTHSMVL